MLIDNEIETLHKIMTETPSGDMLDFPIYRRMFALSVISYINDLNIKLEVLSSELDSTLFDAITIKVDRYLNKDYWTRSWLFSDLWFSKMEKNSTVINKMTDYLPNGIKDYNFTPELMGSFKTAMHQFCDNGKLTERDLKYALNAGIDRMIELLGEIVSKSEHPEPHLFTKLCDEIRKTYSVDDAVQDYKSWKEELGDVSMKDLIAQQKIVIAKMLKSNFFENLHDLPRSSYDDCKIKITANDLPHTFEIADNMQSELAKFDRYFELKGGHIIVINYEKLGRYIYTNIRRLTEEQYYSFVELDTILDLIHEDMSKHRKDLDKYLKNYEENQYAKLLNECAAIINACQCHLRDGIRNTILREYLDMLLHDPEMKDEARNKLKGSSRKKYLCWIIANLSDCYIFKPESSSEELAQSLSKKLDLPLKTIKTYIDKTGSSGSSALRRWTKAKIDELKENPYNPFAGII